MWQPSRSVCFLEFCLAFLKLFAHKSRASPLAQGGSNLDREDSMRCRGWATAVNERRYPLGHLEDGAPSPWTRTSEIDDSFSQLASVECVALFHYVTGSMEEYVAGSARSGDDSEAIQQRYFFDRIQRCAFCWFSQSH
jgi:hypothetical protein